MREEIQFSIRWKLLAVLSSIVFALLLTLTYFQIDKQKQMLNREVELKIHLLKEKLISKGRALSGNLSRQMQNGLATVNLSPLSSLLSKAVQDDAELYYAILMDKNGRAYIHTLKPD